MVALGGTLQAQVIFTNGFENWTDTVPDGWVGVKTNISPDSIEQVGTNPHSGTYAVRLMNASNSTKRFTTLPLSVDSAQSYDVTYWTRGQGEVRIAMFDGRTQNSGYSPTGPYTTVSSNTWVQQTATVVCGKTTAAAEFIIYVRNTISPEALVVDDVNISIGAVVQPTNATVYEIQFTTNANGDSPLNNLPVITGGIVTGVDTIGADSYFIQSGTGPWSGVYVYDQAHQPAIGDSVTFQADVVEFQGVTELSNVTGFTVVGQYPLPAPQLLDAAGAQDEQWEGVLAVVANATCTVLPNGFGEWTVNQPAGDLIVDDLMFAYTPTVGEAYDIVGCLHYANGARKLEPRFIADINTASGIADNTWLSAVTLAPVPATEALTVDLGELAADRVEYTLTDLAGRTVGAGLFTSSRNTVAVNGLPTGSYLLTLRAANALHSVRFVVLH